MNIHKRGNNMDYYTDCFGDLQCIEEEYEIEIDYEPEEKYVCDCANCMHCLGMSESDF
jgi:hypothetical protein